MSDSEAPMPLRNTRELRSFLVQQMNGVASGDVTNDTAKAISNLAQQVYNTLNLEVRMALARAKLDGETVDAVSFTD